MTLWVCSMHATSFPVLSSFIPSAAQGKLFILVQRSGHDPNKVSIMEENRPLTTDF